MTTLLTAAVVVMAAASLVLSALSLVLHKWAPKAKATAEVDVLRKDIDEIKGLLPSPPAQAKNPQAGKIHLTLLALIGLLAVIGCSALSCTAAQKKSLSDFGKCEETAAVKLLEPAVRTVGEDYLAYAACVATGGSDCHGLTKDQAFALLDSLATSYGLDSVGCATTLAAQFFASKASGSADTQSAVDMYDEWLASHGKQAMATPLYRTIPIRDGSASDIMTLSSASNIMAFSGSTSGVYSTVPACAVDNMPGSPPPSDIPCDATITAAGHGAK